MPFVNNSYSNLKNLMIDIGFKLNYDGNNTQSYSVIVDNIRYNLDLYIMNNMKVSIHKKRKINTRIETICSMVDTNDAYNNLYKEFTDLIRDKKLNELIEKDS